MVAGLGTPYVWLRCLSLTPFPRALFGTDEKDGVCQDTADTDKAEMPQRMARGLVEVLTSFDRQVGAERCFGKVLVLV